MEITLNTQVIGIGVVIIIAIIVAHIALVRRTGKMPTRDEFNALSEKVSDLEVTVATSVAELNGRIDGVDARIDAVIDTMNTQFDAVNARIEAVNESVNARIDGLPTQESIDATVRASEARIIRALVNHRHPESAGPPVFTEPL